MSEPQKTYTFDSVFTYDPLNGLLVPKFDIKIDTMFLNKNQALNRASFVGGLNLFDYIGRKIVGSWDPATSILTIAGFAAWG